MKKNISSIVIAIVFLNFFSACQKDISLTVDSKYNRPLLVLNSFLQTDSSATVQVSQSGSVFDNTQPSMVLGADVEFWEDGNLKSKMNYVNGLYRCNYFPKAGSTYTIKASKINFESVEATTTIPNVINILLKNFDSTNYAFSIQINDPSATADYYSLKMFSTDNLHQNYFDNIGLMTAESALLGDSKQQDTGNGHGLNNNNKQPIPPIITDQYFNGTSNIYTLNYSPNNTFNPDPNHYVLKIQNLSAELYKYQKSNEDYRNNNGNPFAEPTLVYSNVKHGLGVVGGGTTSAIIILK